MASSTTVREVVERYLAHSAKVGAHGAEAFAERRRVLMRFAAARLADGRVIGDCPVAELLPHQLSDWIEDNPRWRSSSTRKSKANTVNACFNWAQAGKRIAENPFHGIHYDESEPRPPLEDGFLEVLSGRCSPLFEELAKYLRLTGRRVSEVCGLDWEDIDWDQGMVKLKKHKTRKKTRKDQFYVLVPEALELLRTIRARGEGRERRGEADPGSPAAAVSADSAGGGDGGLQSSPLLSRPSSLLLTGPVFLNHHGRRWSKGSAGQHLYRLKKRLGSAERATLGGLRHQFGTEAVRNGAPLKMVSLQMGHADTRTTEKNYLHLDNARDEIREAAVLGAQRRKIG